MRLGLAFSGGKDSWACLWMAEKELPQIDVIWVNTGKNYPEALELMEHAKALCPRFHEVSVDRDAQNEREGLPSDIVPFDYTTAGQIVSGAKPLKIQNYLSCCLENIGMPLHRKAQELGITHLIRGQRIEEAKKGSARHGDTIYGITYLHPIEYWTKQQVLDYVAENMELPEHFKLDHSSLDCSDCSAFWNHSVDRMAWARKRHPELARQHAARLSKLKAALSPYMNQLDQVMESV